MLGELAARGAGPSRRGGRSGARRAGYRCRGSRGSACRCPCVSSTANRRAVLLDQRGRWRRGICRARSPRARDQAWKRGAGGLHRLVDIGGGAVGDLRQRLAGRRVVGGEGLARLGPVAVDEVAEGALVRVEPLRSRAPATPARGRIRGSRRCGRSGSFGLLATVDAPTLIARARCDPAHDEVLGREFSSTSSPCGSTGDRMRGPWHSHHRHAGSRPRSGR